MELRVLAIGDVVGESGVDFLCRHLPTLRRQYDIHFTVVNGENAASNGLMPQQARDIFSAGADVITLGNHSFSRREICSYLDDCPRILRPANYAPQVPGRGWGEFETKFGAVAVINLQGRCAMDFSPDNPFLLVERILPKLSTRLIFIDFHAEATSEKLAMGYMLDGRISALWGTHTHVPTADVQVLPKGTGYVTDLGMTGPRDSVLGVQPHQSIAKFRGDLTSRYQWAKGPTKLEGVLFTIDTQTGLAKSAERVGTVYETSSRR